MKNLKKVLALVLVVAMMASFATVSAAFPDADSITYTVAVDALAELGIIGGYTDGSYRPTTLVNRGAFAKFTALVMNGGVNVAASYGAYAAAAFNDVAIDNTFANVIGYAVNKGLIDGYPDSTFRPTAPVTGVAAAKILLGALGYRSDVEGYTGDGWKNNVLADASEAKLFTGLETIDLNANLTREQAAQMVWNALQAECVGYSGGSGVTVTTPDGVVVNTANPTVYGKNYTLAWDCFDGNIVASAPSVTADTNGYPTITYTLDYPTGADLELATETLTPVKSYTGAVSHTTIYNDLALTGTSKAATWFIDGWTDTVGSGTALTLNKNGVTSFVGGEGVTVDVYKYGTEVVVSQYANYLAKVTKVNPYKAATATSVEQIATVELDVYGTDYGTVEATFPTDKFAKNDMVIVTLNNAHDGNKVTVTSAVAAGKFEGVMTKYTAANVTVGGTTYALGEKYNALNDLYVAPSSIGFANTYTYYTDANGAILGAAIKNAAIPTDYVYVISAQYQDAASNLLTSVSEAAKASVIFTDGTAGIIDLTITNAGTAAAPEYKVNRPQPSGKVKYDILIGGSYTEGVKSIGAWFAYTVSADGSYNLTEVNDIYADVANGVTLSANTTTNIGNHYTTSATKVNTIDTNLTLTVTTGFPAAEKSLGNDVLYTYAPNSNTVAAIYAVGQSAPTTGVTYAYAVKAGATVQSGTEWIFSVNGVQATYVVSYGEVTEGGIYTLTSNATGYTAEAVSSSLITSDVVVAIADTTLFVDSSSSPAIYTYAANCAVYNVDATDATVVGEADVIEVGDTVTVIVVNSKVVVAYITSAYAG